MKNTKRCHSFQLYNNVDLLLRSDNRLYHSYLEEGMERDISGVSLPHTCTQNLHVFRETRDVVQYPGYNKNTFYPYNHTVMKVNNQELPLLCACYIHMLHLYINPDYILNTTQIPVLA